MRHVSPVRRMYLCGALVVNRPGCLHANAPSGKSKRHPSVSWRNGIVLSRNSGSFI